MRAMINADIASILKAIPPQVTVVAATKTRTPEEIIGVISAGITIVGENYVQEAERKHLLIAQGVQWHLIGHLQRNKVKKAIRIFDMIETLDSLSLAEAVDRECAAQKKAMPVLVEINSGREPQKAGVMPEDAVDFVSQLKRFSFIDPVGVMTMGPATDDITVLRSCFRVTRDMFKRIEQECSPGAGWKHISMGMSNSYMAAIEEGATMVRLGTILFGAR